MKISLVADTGGIFFIGVDSSFFYRFTNQMFIKVRIRVFNEFG